ncbi:hypothetical protein SCD_n01414 [Sulfuricella denitrificans skB26]|uniref:Uncharacterized protein n=1 Tax=Sulfuricella denitrificans (strain DSM 22764 / NBRC 105220 / skB26) TaxID=1163617 RepID=S6AA49_SULDS|nr:hypothetical protein SCD_n01414 [Sulfuricella denitrificans skB26]
MLAVPIFAWEMRASSRFVAAGRKVKLVISRIRQDQGGCYLDGTVCVRVRAGGSEGE